MTIFPVCILLFCICLLALILLNAYVPIRDNSPRAHFVGILVMSILSCVFYLGSLCYGCFKIGLFFIVVLNGLYFAVTAVLPIMWFTYTVKAMKVYRPEQVVLRTIVRSPAAVLVMLSIVSIWTGWLFYVDGNGEYHRGPLYLVYTIVVALYVVVPMMFSLRRAMDKRFYADRSLYLSLSSFGIFCVLGMLLEILVPRLPASAMGMVLTLLVNHMSVQRSQISIDELTNLNNRNKFNRYLSTALHSLPADKKLYLFVLDMDNFKQINDTYGHINGDRALILLSNVLKRVCGPKGHFISRFGGDEFVVVAKYENIKECANLAHEIKATLAVLSKDFVSPLSVSIGYADAVENDNIPDLFNRADKRLYAEKAVKV